jgi:hypothetical protein
MKRISFDEQHATHLYELALEHFCVGNAGCSTCSKLKERLENFIGPVVTKEVIKTIKKNGYCNKLK